MFQVDLGTAPFHVRPDGEPGIDLVALDIARNARFAGKDGIVANGDVASAAGLTGKDDVIAGFGAASDARLGDEETVFTDFDVVAEMDEVVDFRPPADFRRTQGCIIETRAGADFDIVAEGDVADLRDPRMLALFRSKAEAFAADDGVSPDDGVLSEDAVFVDDGTGIEDRTFADLDIIA